MSYMKATKELIIYDIKKVRYSCIDIIKSINGEQLIEAMHLLNTLTSMEGTGDSITGLKGEGTRGPDLVIPPGLIKEYTDYLKASGKRKSTIKDYVTQIKKFIEYIDNKKIDLSNLDLKEINLYLSESRSKKKLSQNTFSKITIIIKSFLLFLFKSKYIGENLSLEIKTPRKVKKEMEFLTDSDLQKVDAYLDCVNGKYKGENLRNRIIFNLASKCGMRRSEVINLDWENIDLENGIIKILDSKGGKDRRVPFNGILREKLKEYRKITEKYSGAAIRGSHGKRISECAIQNIITRIYKESGINRKNMVFHSLRHTYAVGLLNKGTNLFDIMSLLGHSSLDTTQKYLHNLDNDIKKHVLE